jgi:hypothetical protein
MGFSASEIENLASGIGRKQTSIASEEAIDNGLMEILDIWFNGVRQEMSDALFNAKGKDTFIGSQGLKVVPNHTEEQLDISIEAPSYWEFVDKGVNGVEINQGSEFSFRSAGVSPTHQLAIQKWMGENGVVPNGDQTYEQAAYAIARSVKIKGIESTGFVSDVLTDESIETLKKSILSVTGKIISIKLSNGNNVS